MITYVVRRFLIAIATIAAISVVSYAIIQLPPGDFVDSYIARLFFADGTARMIDFNIDPIIMAALLTPDGGEVGATPP
jgi:ABC-type microcin C transport system permease subunit YejB